MGVQSTKTRAALLALLEDNVSGDIAPEDVRDVVVSLVMQDSSENILLPKTAGVGMKLDPITPVFGWRDLTGNIGTRNSGGSVPSFSLYAGTQFQFQMGTGDVVYNEFHMPHDWVVGSDIFVHAHWSQNVGALSGTPGDLTWRFDVSYANGYENGAFDAAATTFTKLLAPTANSPVRTHFISEVQFAGSGGAGDLFDSDNMEVDGIVLVNSRVSINNLDPSAVPFVHYIDLHYQSTNMPTIDKNYPFYT